MHADAEVLGNGKRWHIVVCPLLETEEIEDPGKSLLVQSKVQAVEAGEKRQLEENVVQDDELRQALENLAALLPDWCVVIAEFVRLVHLEIRSIGTDARGV